MSENLIDQEFILKILKSAGNQCQLTKLLVEGL